MSFDEWLKMQFPNKGNNSHTIYSVNDMHSAFYAGTMHGTEKDEKMEELKNDGKEQAESSSQLCGNSEQLKDEKPCGGKSHKAKNTSLAAQIIAALWVAVWCAKKFFSNGGETNDIILSGFAIAACFSPVYFNMILDKVKSIRFGDSE